MFGNCFVSTKSICIYRIIHLYYDIASFFKGGEESINEEKNVIGVIVKTTRI